jgi:23S rRNA pseudouridine2605 synthase
MRINKWLAQNTDLSRRKADVEIENGHVKVNGHLATTGHDVTETDKLYISGVLIQPGHKNRTIMFNKPTGIVCSRVGQGGKTVYDLLPKDFSDLKCVGRLDKDTSGLLLMTSDGTLLNKLTHPKFRKEKIYQVALRSRLQLRDLQTIDQGVDIGDKRLSYIMVKAIDQEKPHYQVRMFEGRNRQIRRTFEAIGNEVDKLHRTIFADYKLGDLPLGKYIIINPEKLESAQPETKDLPKTPKKFLKK